MSGDTIDKSKDKSPEISDVNSALKEIAFKVEVTKDIGTEIKNLYEDIKNFSFDKIFKDFKNIFGMAFVGFLSNQENYEKWKNDPENGLNGLRGNVSDDGVKVTGDVSQQENQETEPRGPRKMLIDDDGKVRRMETMNEALSKERLANMAPPTKDDYDVWYEKDGIRVKRGTKGAKKRWAVKAQPMHRDPKDRLSEFALKYGSSSLFEKTPATYQEFEDNIINKIYPLEKNREKAIEKAANFLSRCAVGRFQILASCNFYLMEWEHRGKEGLENMYKFIKEPQRQVDLYNKIIAAKLKKYDNDPIAVSISYYGGKVTDYLKEKKAGRLVEGFENGKKVFIYNGPKDKGLTADQRGGGTILSYANKALKEFQRSEGMGYNTFERTAMAIEWIESGGKLMNKIYTSATSKKLTT